MTQPGYQQGSESVWWWKVALHLDEAQLALTNAMAHNVEDSRLIHALHDRLRDGQAILLEIFHAKGLLSRSTNGTTNGMAPAPMHEMQIPSVPMPISAAPMGTDGSSEAALPAEAAPPLIVEEPAVPAEDHKALEPEQPAVELSEPAAVAAIVGEESTDTDPFEDKASTT